MDNPVQTSLALFDASPEGVMATQAWLKRSNVAKTRAREPKLVIDQLAQLELDLPLFEIDDFLVNGYVQEITTPAVATATATAAEEETKSWTVELAAMWLAKFLYRHLELLLWSKEGDAGIRSEILNWMFATGYEWRLSEDWGGWVIDESNLQSGVPIPRKKSFVGPPPAELVWTTNPEHGKDKNLRLVPFSFECCCWVEGIDPERIRQSIHARLSEIANSDGQRRLRAALH